MGAVLLEGQALRCDLILDDGSSLTRIFSTATGETLWEGSSLEQLTTRGQSWLLKFDRGSVTEWVFGARGGENQNLWPGDGADQAVLLENGRIATVTPADWGVRLDLFDTQSGRRISSVNLPGIHDLRNVCGDGGSGVWLLGREEAYDRTVICHWDTELTALEDSAVYTAPHYTAAEPDAAGIARMNGEAAALESRYGVDILLWTDATEVPLGGYGFQPEYLVPAMEKYLPRLEAALAAFPEGFFGTAAEKTGTGALNICLVRAIRGSAEYGTLDSQSRVQFWKDGEAYLVIAMDEDLEQSFYHGMMHIIETRVLSVCTAFYEWERLNPTDFQYDNDYILNRDQEDDSYLSGDSRAFVDRFSKSFAREDRAQIFAYACLPGQEAVFRSETMQRKLAAVCDGIRQAFSLPEGTYLWEQYLTEE